MGQVRISKVRHNQGVKELKENDSGKNVNYGRFHHKADLHS
jgi:hypothetical protein